MKKITVRKKVLEARRCIAPCEAAKAAAAITRFFKEEVFPLIPPRTGIACYHSTKSEASTKAVISFLHKKNVPVYLPRVTGKGRMEFRKYEKTGRLIKGTHAIYEPPAAAPKAGRKDVSAVLVPGAAFDRTGARLGLGGGYYDRYLSKLPGCVLKAGIAYSCQLIKKVPLKKHDIKMDLIITEKGVVHARKKAFKKKDL